MFHLWNVSEPDILSKCGYDNLFYLKYLKQVAVLFSVMSFCNIFVLVIYRVNRNKAPDGSEKLTVLESLTLEAMSDLDSSTNDVNPYAFSALFLFMIHLCL